MPQLHPKFGLYRKANTMLSRLERPTDPSANQPMLYRETALFIVKMIQNAQTYLASKTHRFFMLKYTVYKKKYSPWRMHVS
jgi:hypothetical protein